MVLLVGKDFGIGILGMIETMSMVHVVGIPQVTELAIVLSAVSDDSVVDDDYLASHFLITGLNACTNLGITGIVGGNQLANMTGEPGGGAVIGASGVAVELRDGCLTFGLMGPQGVAVGKITNELMTAYSDC